jgi:ABC-type multidrug transport system permease subunit
LIELSKSQMVVLAALSLSLAVSLSYGIFLVACTHSDWPTFVRWMLRAGCL